MVEYLDVSTNPRGITMLVVLWTLLALSGLFVGLRVYSKLSRRKRLWWDDGTVILAWAFLLLSLSSTMANIRLGFGLRIHEIPLDNHFVMGVLRSVSGSTSVFAVLFSKASFALTMLRLTDGWMRWFIVALFSLLVATHCLGALTFWVSCNPPAKTWDPAVPGECWSPSITVNLSLFVGACSAFCDFVFALLPWRLLLRFDIYNKEKVGVAIAMSMGVFAGISCILKMTLIPISFKDKDMSYFTFPIVILGFVEPAVTMMAASVPVMRHLFLSGCGASGRPVAATSTNTIARRCAPFSFSGSSDTLRNPGRDSIGGSREGRLAAVRANRCINNNTEHTTNKSDIDLDINVVHHDDGL
ncbi:hypothetical protein VTH82DRAFT_7853 [Thermothelomyces myriococcoides]